MLSKHQPNEISDVALKEIQAKAGLVFATMPKINQLEQALEIQDTDQELAKSKKNIELSLMRTAANIAEGNK